MGTHCSPCTLWTRRLNCEWRCHRFYASMYMVSRFRLYLAQLKSFSMSSHLKCEWSSLVVPLGIKSLCYRQMFVKIVRHLKCDSKLWLMWPHVYEVVIPPVCYHSISGISFSMYLQLEWPYEGTGITNQSTRSSILYCRFSWWELTSSFNSLTLQLLIDW